MFAYVFQYSINIVADVNKRPLVMEVLEDYVYPTVLRCMATGMLSLA